MKLAAALVSAAWLVAGARETAEPRETLACRDVSASRREELGCPATAANMCECRGYPGASFKPETPVFPGASDKTTRDGAHVEGTCGFADATCDLKWAVVCCDAGDLGASAILEGDVNAERQLQTSIDFESAEEYCTRNGFSFDNFDPNRIAYPGAGFVGVTGYLSGTCGNVVAESDDQFATCCCADASYCCPQGEDSDDCMSKMDLLDLGGSYSYSYSYSYVETDVGPTPPSPADGCHEMEGLDTSVCLENGGEDDDCCSTLASMSCETGFVAVPGELCAGNDYFQTCCYPGCSDSESWYKNGEPSKDCAWVSAFAESRCNAKGQDRSFASYSCPGACGTACLDSMSWYKAGDPSKNCAWVSTWSARCSVKGEDGTLASYACPTACGELIGTPDSDTWYKTGEPSKDCPWVSEFPETRCDVKGWDGNFAWYACPVACGLDATLVDDMLWFKAGEPSKTCSWVSQFPEARCTVRGWSGDLASVGCPLACSQV